MTTTRTTTETARPGDTCEFNALGRKHGREIISQGARWQWFVWDNGKMYADGYGKSRADCDAKIDNLCPI